MTVIRFAVVTAFAFFTAHAVAQNTPENVYGSQPESQRPVVMDTMVACYYKGIPYTEGAVIVEPGLPQPLKCVRKNSSSSNPLVWQ